MAYRITLAIGAVCALALAAPVAAQSSDQDVRCLLASKVFERTEKDPAKRQLAAITSFFYLGRLDARLSPQQLKTSLVAQGQTLKPADLGPVMTACAQRLQAKALALQELGRSLAPPAKPK